MGRERNERGGVTTRTSESNRKGEMRRETAGWSENGNRWCVVMGGGKGVDKVTVKGIENVNITMPSVMVMGVPFIKWPEPWNESEGKGKGKRRGLGEGKGREGRSEKGREREERKEEGEQERLGEVYERERGGKQRDKKRVKEKRRFG